MQTHCSPNTTAIANALLNVQQALSPAVKDATNPFTNSNYATLNSVMGVCRDLLNSNGILLTQMPVVQPIELGSNVLALETRLTHVDSGEFLSSIAIVPLPKNDPQGMGSAITYARRYSLCSILGIVTEDDDGNAASNPPHKHGISPRKAIDGSQRQSSPNREQASPHKKLDPSNHLELKGQTLPKLDGVQYRSMTTDDGRAFVVALGKTLEKKDLLKAAGFKWDSEQKYWWKYADAA